MSKHYDAAAKELLEADPPRWVEFLQLRADGPVTVTDSDVSSVTAAADKVLLVGGPHPYLLHVEFQARRDPGLPGVCSGKMCSSATVTRSRSSPWRCC